MQQTCTQCGTPFEITPDDLAFYDKVSPVFNGKKELIPPPTLCPECREQRRIAWRNNRSLYLRTCSLTGKKVLSIYHPDAPFPVYTREMWWSDAWDPFRYGFVFDDKSSFFEQFGAMLHSIPHPNLSNEANENSDYTAYTGWNKNCYWIFFSDHNEDCCYLEDSFYNRDCMDCSYVHRSTLCYEMYFCFDCYQCAWLQNCINCSDSKFLKNCIGCKHCFGCMNLREREYCLFNEQLTKEGYFEALHALHLDSPEGIETVRRRFVQHCLQYPHPHQEGVHNENVCGNYIQACKNIRNGYMIDSCQDCAYIFDSQRCKDCMDLDQWGGTQGAELVYEGQIIGEGVQRIAFSNLIFSGVHSVYYSDMCVNGCHDLFGCFGLRGKSYCILNTQYSEADYHQLVSRIIARMRNDGEWGEFFPVSLSPHCYNETLAQQYFPLSKEEALGRGYAWREADPPPHHPSTKDVAAFPSNIALVDDSVCGQAFVCRETQKPYKIQKMELAFYRTMGVPLPALHPDARYQRRMSLRNPRKLWDRECAKCQKPIATSYAPDRPEIVYCEACYLKEVY